MELGMQHASKHELVFVPRGTRHTIPHRAYFNFAHGPFPSRRSLQLLFRLPLYDHDENDDAPPPSPVAPSSAPFGHIVNSFGAERRRRCPA
jgi:hypothetical protein